MDAGGDAEDGELSRRFGALSFQFLCQLRRSIPWEASGGKRGTILLEKLHD